MSVLQPEVDTVDGNEDNATRIAYATEKLGSTLYRWKDNLNNNKAVPPYLAYILQEDYKDHDKYHDRDTDKDSDNHSEGDGEDDYDGEFEYDLTLKTLKSRDQVRAQALQSACTTTGCHIFSSTLKKIVWDHDIGEYSCYHTESQNARWDSLPQYDIRHRLDTIRHLQGRVLTSELMSKERFLVDKEPVSALGAYEEVHWPVLVLVADMEKFVDLLLEDGRYQDVLVAYTHSSHPLCISGPGTPTSLEMVCSKILRRFQTPLPTQSYSHVGSTKDHHTLVAVIHACFKTDMEDLLKNALQSIRDAPTDVFIEVMTLVPRLPFPLIKDG